MERRLLQVAVLIASIVPIGAGLGGIIAGPNLFGARSYSVDLISHTAYLSGLLLGIGLVFVASVPRIEQHRTRFVVLGIIVFVGGLARLYSGLTVGFGTVPHQLALVMELIVTPAIVLWQRRVARQT